MVGCRLTSSMPAVMRSLSSCIEATRIWRRTEQISSPEFKRGLSIIFQRSQADRAWSARQFLYGLLMRLELR